MVFLLNNIKNNQSFNRLLMDLLKNYFDYNIVSVLINVAFYCLITFL